MDDDIGSEPLPSLLGYQLVTDECTQHNANAWNGIAEINYKRTQPASYFSEGNLRLNPLLVETAGDLTGKALIQFQCSTGEETISWAILGETATGLDISDIQVGLAREKAKEAGVDATFVHGDVMVLPDEIANGRLASLDFRLDRRSRRRLPK